MPNCRKDKFSLITYGCQMNDYDSEMIAGILSEAGCQLTDDEREAALIIINTCAVRAGAEQRAIGRITQLNSLKRRKPGLIIAVMGCVAQKEARRLARRFPFIDLVVGTRDFLNITKLIAEVEQQGKQLVAVDGLSKPMRFDHQPLRSKGLRALITVIYGCNNFCSYCVVPYVRGREVSRPHGEILNEIEQAVDKGYKEVQLLGQNVNSYYDGELDFADLITDANEIEGLERIRFVTSHPKDLSDKLIDTVAQLPKVCEHIHLPLQAGSDKILRLMNRKYSREYYLELMDKLKQKVPTITLTTDIMVGFPGESEEDFAQTMDMVEQVRWDSAFTFMYTPREGTSAEKNMLDTVPLEEKKRRLSQLIQRTEQISLEKNQQLVGDEVEVLVEGLSRRSSEKLMGRTRGDKVVIFPGSAELPGQVVGVKITEAYAHTLLGMLAKDESMFSSPPISKTRQLI